ncbi:MAG TPA: right-handed parallel beta-helix repeat-containing protein [Tahibacter sp.]|nr:right-handed parallel beta-helix repeat-containing protein [Tahibacter sp.]
MPFGFAIRKSTLVLAAAAVVPSQSLAQTLTVGPGQMYPTPCAAVAAATAGSTILIDAAGNYDGNVCAWSTSGLTLRGVNGRPRIDAAGNHAQGKAIWVIAGNDTTIENIELSGCRVPDGNGAGIRQEGRNLTLRRMYFHDNENGILAGDKSGSTILIEHSEFARNGAGDGQTHNLYVNHVDTLIFRYNWSHGASVGHLLKSRARQNFVLYNRMTGEAGGTESYEINLPSGGTSYVIGNVLQQPSTSQNGAMLDYLSEPGSANPDDRLFVVNNTFVNNRSAGTFVQAGASTATSAVLRNNIFFGNGAVTNQATATLDHNLATSAAIFVDAANYDYRLLPGVAAIDAGTDPGIGAGQALTPTMQYRHPVDASPRPIAGAVDIGAYEWLPDAIFGDGFQ